MRLRIALLLSLWIAPAWAGGTMLLLGAGPGTPSSPFSLSQTGTNAHQNGATSSNYTGITVGSSDNALLLGLSCNATGTTAPSSFSATWDSGGAAQSMTQLTGTIVSGNNGSQSSVSVFFGLVSPVSGNKTLAISWTTTATCNIKAWSFIGANSVLASAFQNGTANTGTSSSPSLTVTSSVGAIVFATAGLLGANATSCNGTIATSTDTAGSVGNAAKTWSNGAASVTIGCTLNTSGFWSESAISVSQ